MTEWKQNSRLYLTFLVLILQNTTFKLIYYLKARSRYLQSGQSVESDISQVFEVVDIRTFWMDILKIIRVKTPLASSFDLSGFKRD